MHFLYSGVSHGSATIWINGALVRKFMDTIHDGDFSKGFSVFLLGFDVHFEFCLWLEVDEDKRRLVVATDRVVVVFVVYEHNFEWTQFWTPKASQERPKSVPKPPKIEPTTRKKRCLKTSRFQTRCFHGLEVVFNCFLDDFWKPNVAEIAKTPFLRKPEK